ncbi:MAG: hypothetical protein QM778_20395 [Myxococcales bacterium]
MLSGWRSTRLPKLAMKVSTQVAPAAPVAVEQLPSSSFTRASLLVSELATFWATLKYASTWAWETD